MEELEGLIVDRWPELSAEKRENIRRFYAILIAENAKQNLTRLTSPLDFYEGHVEDVRQLLGLGWLTYPALDLGSGGGVPGLLSAAISPAQWVLSDSELSKAKFLSEATAKLNLGSLVTIYGGRAEAFLKNGRVECVVARAVGPISRIFSWIGQCSTWNKLILFKGPAWDDEWADFKKAHKDSPLTWVNTHEYSVGIVGKRRKIVLLTHE